MEESSDQFIHPNDSAGNSLQDELQSLKLRVLQLECILEAKDKELYLLRQQFGGNDEQGPDLEQLRLENAQLKQQLSQLQQSGSPNFVAPGTLGPKEVSNSAAAAADVSKLSECDALLTTALGILSQLQQRNHASPGLELPACDTHDYSKQAVARPGQQSPRPPDIREAANVGLPESIISSVSLPSSTSIPALPQPDDSHKALDTAVVQPPDEHQAGGSSSIIFLHPAIHNQKQTADMPTSLPATHQPVLSGSMTKPETAACPSVFEVNVSGTPVFLEARLLQKYANTRLFALLTTEAEAQPKDSLGRIFLPYNPQWFGLLVSVMQELDLFGMHAIYKVNWRSKLGQKYDSFERLARFLGLYQPLLEPFPQYENARSMYTVPNLHQRLAASQFG